MQKQSDTLQRAAASPLGKPVAYQDQYDPQLLFPIPRAGKREEIGIAAGQPLPFCGHDLWNAYELSWLNVRGKPEVAIAQFVVPADSPCIIESKSLKLYLNAFNQTRIGCVAELSRIIGRDLSAACGAQVQVRIDPLSQRPTRTFAYPSGVLLDTLDLEIDCYQPRPGFLTTTPGEVVSETLFSHLLKSNCLVTGQPDWGMLVVRYTGRPIERAGLLRYIVSFRGHDEFHEQCVERIYCDLQQRCKPQVLTVSARYTRRGGLDINPVRSSVADVEADNLMEVRQ